MTIIPPAGVSNRRDSAAMRERERPIHEKGLPKQPFEASA
jgi:hypothetical protein